MKRSTTVLIFLLLFLSARTQKVQTIVPEQVVEGNAFQVQYIISDPSALSGISTPEFENLRLISGPNHYKGNSMVNGKMQAIENISFTFVPLKEGLVRIKGITIDFNKGEDEKTHDIILNVSPQPKASFNALSTYTDISLYAPSSKANLDQLIEENLFIRTEVNKTVCFLGEAIVATFKLYSRLQSTSEVVNAPSLYGFSVLDIFSINEVRQTVEVIGGKVFNTSVLRKLQLFPAQTGKLVIDAMQLQNEIEFEDSVTGKKIKVEKLLASRPLEISVKALPGKKPEEFNGAIGDFQISARLQTAKIGAAQQGKLIVSIKGKGNFIQFAPPVVEWPGGFDVFDPLVTDQINKTMVPAQGARTYTYLFTTNHAGRYSIPSLSFSFFDPQKGRYRNVKSDPLKFEVVAASKQEHYPDKRTSSQTSKKWIWLSAIGFSLLFLVFYLKKKKSKPALETPVSEPDHIQTLRDIASSGSDEKQLCMEVQKLLNNVAKKTGLSAEQTTELQSISNYCQLMIYSDISVKGMKEELLRRTENFLTGIKT